MKERKNFLRMINIFVFLLIISIVPGYADEADKRDAKIRDLNLYIQNHRAELEQRVEQRKLQEDRIRKDVMRLKELEPSDINSIEIFKIELDYGVRERLRQLSYINRKVINGFISLCKNAENYKGPKTGRWFLDANYIIVVNLKNNEALEIPYFLSLSSPLGEQLESKELCEALCAMTIGFRGSIIHFDQGKIIDVTKFSVLLQQCVGAVEDVILPNQTGSKNTLNMNEKGKLFLTMEKRINGKVIMNETKPFHYGQAQIFNHDGPGDMIVYIEHPADNND